MSSIATPSSHYTFGTQSIFMSFGAVKELTEIVGGPDGVQSLFLDTVVQERVLKRLLSPRGANGEVLQEIDLNTLDVPLPEIIRLLTWAGEHITDFFLQGVEALNQLTKSYNKAVTAEPSTPTSTGS